jgi:hypothetical protein
MSEDKLSNIPPFTLSLGAKSAVGLMKAIDKTKTTSQAMNEEIVWCFRLLYQFSNELLHEDNNEAWEQIKEFITCEDLSAAVFTRMDNFDFSDENIDRIEKLVEGNRHKIDPTFYNKIDELSGFLIFALKDAAEYAGLIPEKRTPARHYSRLQHKKNKLLSS